MKYDFFLISRTQPIHFIITTATVWTSYSTGQYVTAVSPTTWGDRDPIAEHRLKIYRGGTAEEKAKSEAIYRRENWLVNVYVVNDPADPENNDTVKILRFW